MRPFVLLVLIGCQKLDGPRAPVELDRPFFDCNVQPILTQYCSALACHGTTERYFHVFARNRLRIDPSEPQRKTFMTTAERDHNFAAAAAMIDPAAPDTSLLLHKPLEPSAGGAFHVGATLYKGGNVFATADDPDYQVLVQWAAGATADPACKEPGSDQ